MDSPGKYGGNPGKGRAEMSSKKDAGKQDCKWNTIRTSSNAEEEEENDLKGLGFSLLD